MWIENSHYYAFIASCAEIFGALVGLLSLVYVYKTESARSNIERVIANIDRIVKKSNRPEDLDTHHEVGVEDIDKILEILTPYLTAVDVSALRASLAGLRRFTSSLQELKVAFVRSAAAAFTVLFTALAGLAFPYSASPDIAQLIFIANFILVLIASVLTVQFVRRLGQEEHSYHIASD